MQGIAESRSKLAQSHYSKSNNKKASLGNSLVWLGF